MSIREEDGEPSGEQGKEKTVILNGMLESRSKGGEEPSPEKHLEKTIWGKGREQFQKPGENCRRKGQTTEL